MSKNPWTNMKRKTEKRESTDSVQEVDLIESSRTPKPNDPSIYIGHISDIHLNNPLKNEVVYPDTRFPCSTTLFPAEGVEEECLPSEASSEAFKRCAEYELISTMPKKVRVSGSSETINPIISDCMIIENTKKQVKVEVIDLTEDSHSIAPVLCHPVRIADLKRVPGKPNTKLQTYISLKVKSSEKTCQVNGNVVGAADMNYRAIQAKQSKVSEVNTDKSSVDTNKKINSAVNNPSSIQVKTEKSTPSESINDANYDQLSIELHVGNPVPIKDENSNSSENNTLVNLENSQIVINKDGHSKIRNIHLRSELDKENEGNRGVNGQGVSSTVSACIEKNSIDAMTSAHQFNDVPIKVEQNENRVVSGNSTSLSNFSSDVNPTGMNSVNRPIKSEQSKTNENCEVSNNCMLVPNSPSVCCTELETEHLSKVVNKQQTYEKVKDRMAKCAVSNEEVQKNVICKENKKCMDSPFNYLTVAQLRNKSEKDFQKNSCNYEKPQNDEDISPECTEALIRDELNRISFSPITANATCLADSQLYEPGKFQTPLLRYFNCNMKVDVREISCVISALNSINEKEEINVDCNNVIESEVIPNSENSQYKFESCLTENREELQNLQVHEEQSLKVDEILDKISSSSSFKELMDSIPNVSNLVSNSASPRLEESIEERQVPNPLNSDGLGGEMEQNNSTNIFFDWLPKKSGSIRVRESYSPAVFNSSVNTKSLLEDNYKSTISLPSLDDKNRNETSNILPMEAKKKPNKKLLSYDFLRQILGNAKSAENSDIADISSSLKPFVDQVEKSNIIIDESVFQNLRQIRLIENKTAESTNFTSNVNEKNSEHTVKNSEKFSKSLLVPNENVFKQGVNFNLSAAYGDVFGTPPKRVKISKDALIPKSDSVKKLSYEKYKKRGACTMASSHYAPDHLLSKHFASDTQSNSSDSSPCSSNLEQNMLTPPGKGQNRRLPVCSDTNLKTTGYRPMVNVNYSQDPRLAPKCYPTLHTDVNSQEQMDSFNIIEIRSSQRAASEARKSSVHPHVKQTPSVSTTNVTRNSSSVQSSTESFLPPVIAMKIQQVNQMISEVNSFPPSDFNQRTSEKNNRVFLSASTSGSSTFSMTQHNPHQWVQDVKGHQPLLSLPYLPGNASSQLHHLMSQEIHPQMSRHSALTPDHYSSESGHREFMPNPPLPTNSPPPLPPLPPASPSAELSPSIDSDCSQNSLLHIKKHVTTKSSSSEFKFSSLLPKQLKKDIGKNIIHTNDVYLIVIERNIDWIHGIDKENRGELLQVRDSYANHLIYYNTYFPLLLLDCFSKISTALKGTKREKIDKNICKIVRCKTKQNYISFTCHSFIRQADVESIPKDGHVILVKFATVSPGGVRMLGFVCSSGTRAYSHRHDRGHEILKYVNVNNLTELIKIKITFYIVFTISGINLDLPIEVSKLTSIKKALTLNDALKELQRSPLCNAILSPRNNNFKSFALPRRQDTNTMTTVVHEIVQSLNSSTPQLIAVESAPFSDPFLAIVQIVEEIQKTKIPGKILVCVRMEMLSPMGMNLVETSSNVIIINRERENVHEKLQNRVLDVMVSHLSDTRNIPDDVAKSKVLQEADVLLAVTGTCFYEDVQCMAKDLVYCIIHDAQSFTEPESLLPLLYGIRHLLLFGYHEESCHVSSKRAASLGYNKSLYHRAYNLC